MFRLLARLFDYALTFSALYLIGAEIDIFQRWPLILVTAGLTPIIWQPFEWLFKHLFKKTPGKAFFGLRYEDGKVISGRKGWRTALLGAIFIGVFLSSPAGWDKWHRGPAIAMHHVDPKDYKDWTAFESPDKAFSVYFPSKCESKDVEMVIPGEATLILKQHATTVEGKGTFSVAHTQVESKFLKYSDKLILRHALVNMAENLDKTELVTRNFATHGEVQAIDYVLKSNGKDVLGRMILVHDRLYKLEHMTDGITDEAKQTQALFISSFLLTN